MHPPLRPVLIIDDEPHIIEALTLTVKWEKFGFSIGDAVSNAQCALELLKSNRYSLIFTDIRMPGVDGLKLIEKIRESDSDTEVVIISGYNNFEYAKRAISLKVSSYILKPIDPEEVEQFLAQMKAKFDSSENIQKPLTEVYGDFGEVIQYVNDNYRKSITVKDLSEKFHINTAYLGVKFKQATGDGFHSYINKLRIEYVKANYRRRNCKMSFLITDAGFSSHQHFYKQFRKIEGMPFNEYASKH